eukprot:scaffold329910_cov64-Tisochrysis_lutea.AAC.1
MFKIPDLLKPLTCNDERVYQHIEWRNATKLEFGDNLTIGKSDVRLKHDKMGKIDGNNTREVRKRMREIFAMDEKEGERLKKKFKRLGLNNKQRFAEAENSIT